MKARFRGPVGAYYGPEIERLRKEVEELTAWKEEAEKLLFEAGMSAGNLARERDEAEDVCFDMTAISILRTDSVGIRAAKIANRMNDRRIKVLKARSLVSMSAN